MAINLKVPLIVKKFDKKLDEIIHEDLPLLAKIKRHVIESGGKRIRPLTHYFITQLYGYKGNDWTDIGAIAELIHGASLLHDDVVDGAELRRGKETVGKLYGNKTAILSGDYLLACGIEHLNRFQNPLLMDCFTRVIRDLAVGELIQMEWEKNPKITLDIYHKIIYGKTASLFGVVCETAGILSDCSKKEIKELHNFGLTMGMLFQKKDDYIDYFEMSESSGKVPMKDFQNGLFTYPIILLSELMTKSEKQYFYKILSYDQKTTKELDETRELLSKYKIQEKILTSLKKDSLHLTQFLGRFEKSPIKNLMVERIESILN